MTIPEEKKAGYITLKEAGERFGYSQDYLGQLIRKGKLEGKLVYSHVAWVTTPEAVEEYLAGGKKKKQGAFPTVMDEIVEPAAQEPSPIEAHDSPVPVVLHEEATPPSWGSRSFLGAFRVLLLLIALLGVYVFYLMVSMLGSILTAQTNVASASVVFSVPVVSPVFEQHAVALTSRHE
jgi:hypothetical protein